MNQSGKLSSFARAFAAFKETHAHSVSPLFRDSRLIHEVRTGSARVHVVLALIGAIGVAVAGATLGAGFVRSTTDPTISFASGGGPDGFVPEIAGALAAPARAIAGRFNPAVTPTGDPSKSTPGTVSESAATSSVPAALQAPSIPVTATAPSIDPPLPVAEGADV